MSFWSSSQPLEMKVVGVSLTSGSGSVIKCPTRARKGEPSIPEMLGRWIQNSNGSWSLEKALLFGLSGTKGGPFEVITFGLKAADCKMVLQGQVLGSRLYDDHDRKQTLATVFVNGEGHFWQFTCQRELLKPAAVYFTEMPKAIGYGDFNHPDGYDLGLGKFCEPKVVAVNGEKASPPANEGNIPEPEKPAGLTPKTVKLAKLRKKSLKLPGEKEHLACYCIDNIVRAHLQKISNSARTLVKIGDEILPLLKPSDVGLWKAQLSEVKATLESFERCFFSGTDPVPGFQDALDWPAHTAKFNATRLAPRLVGEIIASSKIFPAIPGEFKPLFDRKLHVCGDTGEFLMASDLRGAIEDIGTFLELITAKS